MPTIDMFDGTKPRRKARVMAHVYDAGDSVAKFVCKKCGWDSGWLEWEDSVSSAKKGIPCEQCNK